MLSIRNKVSLKLFFLLLSLFGSNLNAQQVESGAYGINPLIFGMSTAAKDNSQALKAAIEQGNKTGLPVIIPGAFEPYRISGDLVLSGNFAALKGGGGNVHLEFDGGGIIIGEQGEKWRGQVLEDLVLSRKGEAGPVITVKTTRKARHSRFTWENIHILNSSGDGIVFEGSFLGAITGLWVTKCAGTGIVFRPGDSANSNAAGANSIGFFGGEVQSCDWGIEATDTKSVSFNAFAIEGNRLGGIWLHGDNRAFSFIGGYFENNAKAKTKLVGNPAQYTDVLIGDGDWEGRPNRNIKISGSFFSDGKKQHKSAISIEQNQQSVMIENSHFWAYSDSPILLIDGKANNSTGVVTKVINERPDKKKLTALSHSSKIEIR